MLTLRICIQHRLQKCVYKLIDYHIMIKKWLTVIGDVNMTARGLKFFHYCFFRMYHARFIATCN